MCPKSKAHSDERTVLDDIPESGRKKEGGEGEETERDSSPYTYRQKGGSKDPRSLI